MDKDLVQIQGQLILTNSQIVAEKFGKNHQYVLQKIDKLKAELFDLRCKKPCTLNSSEKHKIIKIFKEKTRFYRGQNFRYVEMNRPAFSLLCMRFSGKKALEWQDKFNDAFYQMEQVLLQQSNLEWKGTREQGKQIRLDLTDEIKTFVEYATEQGSKSAHRYYSNITKMEYVALGWIAYNEKVSDDFRNTLNSMDLNHLLAAENTARKALIEGMEQKLHYKDIFQLAKANVIQLADIMVIKPKITA